MAKDKKLNTTSQDEEVMDTSTMATGENGTAHDTENTGPSYEDKFKYMNAMTSPVAPKKLAKKLFKCIKQAAKQKNYIRLGLRETQKYIRRGERGLVVFAGNVTPIDIYSHMPVVCGKTFFTDSMINEMRIFCFFRRSKYSVCICTIKRRFGQCNSC